MSVFEFGNRYAVAAGWGWGEVVPANQLVFLQEVLNSRSEDAGAAPVNDVDPRLPNCVVSPDVRFYSRH